jgi:hypothetical protein
MKEGWSGGLENFSLQEKFGEDRTVTAEGHIIPNQNDYKLAITLEKNDVGFVRVGFEEFRKYFSDVGGYYAPFATNSFNLGRDLHLDTGKAWVEFGLTLPSWPKIVLGYEYQFRDGAKSLPQWGGVYDADADVTRLIYPAYKDIEERAHIIKLDVSHDIHGTLIEDNFRAEFYDQKTAQVHGWQPKPRQHGSRQQRASGRELQPFSGGQHVTWRKTIDGLAFRLGRLPLQPSRGRLRSGSADVYFLGAAQDNYRAVQQCCRDRTRRPRIQRKFVPGSVAGFNILRRGARRVVPPTRLRQDLRRVC